MQVIFKMIGGSRSYHLHNEDSDFDERGVFLNTDVSKIIGLDRYEHQEKRSGDEDNFYYEFRHFMNLLRKTNTSVMELIYSEEWLETTSEFQLIQENKEKLIDTDKLFKSISGYLHDERRLTLGERTGLLGGKRKETLDKYGYSNKNLTNFLRLIYCGATFFQDGFFPVNCEKYLSKENYGLLKDIKNNPKNYNKESATKLMDEAFIKFNNSYDNRKFSYQFDEDLANKLIYNIYMPVLQKINL